MMMMMLMMMIMMMIMMMTWLKITCQTCSALNCFPFCFAQDVVAPSAQTNVGLSENDHSDDEDDAEEEGEEVEVGGEATTFLDCRPLDPPVTLQDHELRGGHHVRGEALPRQSPGGTWQMTNYPTYLINQPLQ